MYNINSCPKRPKIIENVYNFMQKTCANCSLECEVSAGGQQLVREVVVLRPVVEGGK